MIGLVILDLNLNCLIMLTLPLNQILNAIERHIALSGPRAGEVILYFSDEGFSIGYNHASGHCQKTGQNNSFKPISGEDLKLLKTFEIQAKLGGLSEEENTEYEYLKRQRNYYRLKKMYPHLSHEELVKNLNVD